MGCSFTSCLGRKSGKQFYIMPRTKKGVQFYVVLRTKVGCSFMSCPGRRSDAVLRHAQDENKFKAPQEGLHCLGFTRSLPNLKWERNLGDERPPIE